MLEYDFFSEEFSNSFQNQQQLQRLVCLMYALQMQFYLVLEQFFILQKDTIEKERMLFLEGCVQQTVFVEMKESVGFLIN